MMVKYLDFICGLDGLTSHLEHSIAEIPEKHNREIKVFSTHPRDRKFVAVQDTFSTKGLVKSNGKGSIFR